MESLNSVHFIKLDPFYYRKNIEHEFKNLIKGKNIQYLLEIRELLEQRMKQLTETNLIIPKNERVKLLNGTLLNH